MKSGVNLELQGEIIYLDITAAFVYTNKNVERGFCWLLLLPLFTANRTELVEVLRQLDPVNNPIQLKLRGKRRAAGLARLHL